MSERYPDNEPHRPQAAMLPTPLLRGSICLAALSRDPKPQEGDSDEDKQGLEDEVHFRIGKVMKAKDPMDPDDIEAQDEAYARERSPKE